MLYCYGIIKPLSLVLYGLGSFSALMMGFDTPFYEDFCSNIHLYPLNDQIAFIKHVRPFVEDGDLFGLFSSVSSHPECFTQSFLDGTVARFPTQTLFDYNDYRYFKFVAILCKTVFEWSKTKEMPNSDLKKIVDKCHPYIDKKNRLFSISLIKLILMASGGTSEVTMLTRKPEEWNNFEDKIGMSPLKTMLKGSPSSPYLGPSKIYSAPLDSSVKKSLSFSNSELNITQYPVPEIEASDSFVPYTPFMPKMDPAFSDSCLVDPDLSTFDAYGPEPAKIPFVVEGNDPYFFGPPLLRPDPNVSDALVVDPDLSTFDAYGPEPVCSPFDPSKSNPAVSISRSSFFDEDETLTTLSSQVVSILEKFV